MYDFSKYHLCEEPRIISPTLPGKRSRQLLRVQRQIEGSIVSYPRNFPIAIKRAKGAIIEDVDGNRLLDFFAGAGVLNLGHCNEEVLEYVENQQKLLIHALDFPTDNKLKAIQRILGALPEAIQKDYKVSFGGPTGSDAVEAAVKLAKMKTGRENIIAFTGGYHGMTTGALALTSDVRYRKKLPSLLPNVHFTPFPYCYRCPLSLKPASCGLRCLNYLKNILENSNSGISKPAAIILEPIQGEGGNIPAPKGFLEDLILLARRHEVLVIFDEIQSGFFRSGQFLAFMNATELSPDIITISKGIGGVGFPLSGLIYKKSVEAWGPGDHIGTFRSNQVSLAATNGAFAFVEKYKVKEHAEAMGKKLMDELLKLKKGFPQIGDVRGKGLMIGLEFVEGYESKKPNPIFTEAFKNACFQKGLLFEVGGHFSNVIRMVPPLIITPKIIDAAIGIIKLVLTQLAEKKLEPLVS